MTGIARRPRARAVGRLAALLIAAVASVAAAPPPPAGSRVAGRPAKAVPRLRANVTPFPDFERICHSGHLDDSERCTLAVLAAGNLARAEEDLGPMSFDVSAFDRLSVTEQIFVVTNLERVARGLRPMSELTAQLDAVARRGVDLDDDPSLDAETDRLRGGASVTTWGSLWAGDTFNALASNYYYMYEDGFGPPNENVDCATKGSLGCWGHRSNLLGTYADAATCSGVGPPVDVMGAAFSPVAFQRGPSFAEILVGVCGPEPPDAVFTWATARRLLHISAVPADVAAITIGDGYLLVRPGGSTAPSPDTSGVGGLLAPRLNASVVAASPTPDGRGAWLAAADGGVFPLGDAGFYGSAANIALGAPVTAIAAAPDGRGYWIVTATGHVRAFGDAVREGSAGRLRPGDSVVAITATGDGRGYWLATNEGRVLSFGDAPALPSPRTSRLRAPIVGIAVTRDARGYWLVTSDGEVISFGDAPALGSPPPGRLRAPVIGLAATADGRGYWLVTSDGQVLAFGDAAGDAGVRTAMR